MASRPPSTSTSMTRSGSSSCGTCPESANTYRPLPGSRSCVARLCETGMIGGANSEPGSVAARRSRLSSARGHQCRPVRAARSARETGPHV
jgi:hypothetical protein